MMRLGTVLVCLAAWGGSLGWASPRGSLVMVGGGLRASNAAIYQEFIARTGETGSIGIIPLASGKPVESGHKFRDNLIRYGVPAERIHLLPLAYRDDSTTSDVDESTWRRNARNPKLAERLADFTGLWFTGGDQNRITSTLRTESGEETVVLRAIRQLYARGGVIGGTSAGAAMQSEVMILGGTSPFALTEPPRQDYPDMESQENGPLVIGDGLGFFPHGIIDQHFERKARLGRLIAALLGNPAGDRIGFGIDEDTALVYDASTGKTNVIGASNVVLVDARDSKTTPEATTGIRLSLFGNGDRLELPALTSTIHSGRTLIREPYLDVPTTNVSSLLTPYGGRLEDALGFLLVDNAATQHFTTRVATPAGATAELRFETDTRSEGFWGYVDGQRDSYSVRQILVSCRPGLDFLNAE